ncbi:MAG TPA: Asp-tRNA(Asn)/Glu-tRNA(Gln) amidotransferase subunit GatA [Candidatus Limnocylindrales bacterium]|nr:Asp-tRNA(Asn)/Glu-tRNA(Gln) amidotransferase subunit GatA [Candidatus Limnocylindrales bacterium]
MVNFTLLQAINKLKNGEVSSVELTKAYLDRIKKIDSKINSFVTVTDEDALKSAKSTDEKRANGSDLPLLGIPLSIKDNFSTIGVRTTASSKVLDKYIPPYDATVVKKLKNAGMVMLGKTNMDAWAHGSSTETSDFGTTKNPWNVDHYPGGSSGGAAASVSADLAVAGIGSETGGSIRQPASWCGVVGLKPTFGRVSRYGVVAMGSSLDSPGPITKTVEDSAIILQILAGQDPHDATTSPLKVPDYLKNMKNEIKGLKIGVSDDYFEGVNNEVKTKVEEALKKLEILGAIVKKIKLFPPKYTIAVYTILMRSEVSSNLARYDGIRYGNDRSYFGDEAKRRIMLGTYALSAGYYDQYFNKALKVRTVIIEDFKKAFKDVDVIIAPTSPVTALKIGSAESKDPMFGELSDVLVEPSSLAGLSAINVPCGFSKAGLPIGIDIMGPQFGEEVILNVAYKYEQATEWHLEKPKL